MVIHAALAVQHAQRFAASAGDGGARPLPLIFGGDFNIKPGDATYALVTEGALAEDHPEYPRAPPHEPWRPVLEGGALRSAYFAATGAEPDFTNHAQTKDDPPFIETLDYLFCSEHWDVASVLPLANRTEVSGPYPTASEPSDHVLIGAEFALP